MEFAHVWFATYNYALDANGEPIISLFASEYLALVSYVVWQYPFTSRIVAPMHLKSDMAPNTSWSINHLGMLVILLQDKSRNITILEN